MSCSPTMAPTGFSCSDTDEATFEVAIDFNYYSDDVSWNLLSMCTGEKLFEKVYSAKVTLDLHHVCIPRGRFIFKLSDSFGDGLGYPFYNLPDGSVIVNYDGDDYELEIEGDFGYFATAAFGDEASCFSKVAQESERFQKSTKTIEGRSGKSSEAGGKEGGEEGNERIRIFQQSPESTKSSQEGIKRI